MAGDAQEFFWRDWGQVERGKEELNLVRMLLMKAMVTKLDLMIMYGGTDIINWDLWDEIRKEAVVVG